MFKNYLKIMVRNFARYKAYSFINIVGLAVGITACVLILLWIMDELSFDRHHENYERICRIVHEQHFSDQVVKNAKSPHPLGAALRASFPEILKTTRFGSFVGEVLMRHEDRAFYEIDGAYVDPEFFEIFSVPLLLGNPEKIFPDRFCVLVSAEMAQKYFGDENPVGKILKLENIVDMKITGVFKNTPSNSHLQYQFLVPFTLYEAWGSDLSKWNSWPDYTYALLRQNTSLSELNRKIADFMRTVDPKSEDKLSLQPLSEIHLHSQLAYDYPAVLGDIQWVYIFGFVALFILIIACFNSCVQVISATIIFEYPSNLHKYSTYED